MADFGGRYRRGRLLGAGGMGEVWLAYDEDLGDRPVAIKVMRSALLPEQEDAARFQREMRLAARMQHPNIMTVYTTGTDNGTPFMVLEYLEGSDLSKAVAGSAGRPPAVLGPGQVARIGGDTCAALAYAHGLGVVHRDIKPGNLFLCDSGPVKIADFGIAKAVSETRLTATGTLVGTFPYMAPEQWLGEPAAFSNDIWATGCVLYDLLSGTLPRSYATPPEYVAAAARGEHVASLANSAGIPSWLADAITAMLQPDPRDRPSAADCETLLAGPAADLPGAGMARPGWRDVADTRSRAGAWPGSDASGWHSRGPDGPRAVLHAATANPAGIRMPAEEEADHLLWALTPILSLGLLLPFPFARSAARRHSLKLWALTFPYALIWTGLWPAIIVQGSLGHLKPALACSIWLLSLSALAALHSLWLRHRVFRVRSTKLASGIRRLSVRTRPREPAGDRSDGRLARPDPFFRIIEDGLREYTGGEHIFDSSPRTLSSTS